MEPATTTIYTLAAFQLDYKDEDSPEIRVRKDRINALSYKALAMSEQGYGLGALACTIVGIVVIPLMGIAAVYHALIRKDRDTAGMLITEALPCAGRVIAALAFNVLTLGYGLSALCAYKEFHKPPVPTKPLVLEGDAVPSPSDSSSGVADVDAPSESPRTEDGETRGILLAGATAAAGAVAALAAFDVHGPDTSDPCAAPLPPFQAPTPESSPRAACEPRPVDHRSERPVSSTAAQLRVQPPSDLLTLSSGLRTPVVAPTCAELRAAVDPGTPRPAAAVSAAPFRAEASQPRLVISKQQKKAMDVVLQFFRDVKITARGIYQAQGPLEALNEHAPELRHLSDWTLLGIALASGRWRAIIRQVQGDKSQYVDITPVLLKSEGKSVPAILKELVVAIAKSLFAKKATKYQQLLQLILPDLDNPFVVNSLERDIEDIRRTFCYLTTERLERVVEIATRLLRNKKLSFGERQQAIEEILQQAYAHAEETGHQDFLQVIDE